MSSLNKDLHNELEIFQSKSIKKSSNKKKSKKTFSKKTSSKKNSKKIIGGKKKSSKKSSKKTTKKLNSSTNNESSLAISSANSTEFRAVPFYSSEHSTSFYRNYQNKNRFSN